MGFSGSTRTSRDERELSSANFTVSDPLLLT
jgi:hypothetical protein